jgi:hypothetical protein
MVQEHFEITSGRAEMGLTTPPDVFLKHLPNILPKVEPALMQINSSERTFLPSSHCVAACRARTFIAHAPCSCARFCVSPPPVSDEVKRKRKNVAFLRALIEESKVSFAPFAFRSFENESESECSSAYHSRMYVNVLSSATM